ncbi:carboxylate-amine ligase [Auraticoccus monumenti]|uniref:Putative glutamate--cysteine ligase 2 n=1 Tax=Auraticoccus monumenti TaxID=675864 RepID=A0A1G7A597_9ACTN|nr:glutamate--cysteine ligase [Auraticoccus monumenti]SDE10108.1 carboxylate-amine ligase [Auraticoccus monumenti]
MAAPAARNLGVEEEFLLFDAQGPGLRPVGDAVATAATLAGAGHQYDHEFKQVQVELGTRPSTDLADVRQQLRERRTHLAAAAAEHGARLVAVGISPVEQDALTTPDERYQRMEGHFGHVARHQLSCGMHVHVQVDSDRERVAVVDRLQPWLPVLVALSGNSPFWGGEDTGYDSFRSLTWGQWPTSGPTARFGDLATYRDTTSTLVGLGGALDEGGVYYPARLSPRYPTVEVRVSDVCASSEDAVSLAALVRAMVETAVRDEADGVLAHDLRAEVLRASYWRAARFGVHEHLLDPTTLSLAPAWDVVGRLVARVGPALEQAGDLEPVQEGLATLRQRGTGAALQRATLAAGSWPDVVDALAAATLG